MADADSSTFDSQSTSHSGVDEFAPYDDIRRHAHDDLVHLAEDLGLQPDDNASSDALRALIAARIELLRATPIEVLRELVVWGGRSAPTGATRMTPVVDGDYLYAIDGRKPRDNALTCIDLKTGKSMWRWLPVFDEEIDDNGEKRTASFGIGLGSLLKVGDRYLLLAENGHLLLMKLSHEKRETLARAWLFCARDTWALPPLVDGLLYVNQNQRDSLAKTKPRLICYDLRQETKPWRDIRCIE